MNRDQIVEKDFTASTDTEIPILSLGDYLAGRESALEALAMALRRAQENIGFYYIVDHGVPSEVIASAFAALAEFFALPETEKLSLKVNDRMIGYLPLRSTIYKSSKFNRNTKKDMNETILLVRDDDEMIEPNAAARNKWPPCLPEFRNAMLAYQVAMEKLGHTLLPLYARALCKPEDFFAEAFSMPRFISRNSHYPARNLEDNQFGIAPHSDAGFLTLLPLSDVPGLEIMLPSGKWIAAPPVDGAILVNTGEFLNRWTNGRFLATPHRVVQVSRDRYSMAFFFNPADDTVAEPLDTCISEDHPSQFEAITIREYRDWYAKENFLHRRAAD